MTMKLRVMAFENIIRVYMMMTKLKRMKRVSLRSKTVKILIKRTIKKNKRLII